LGEHPESGKSVAASVGRFGPYVVHDGRYVSLKAPDDVLEIDLERALELLSAAPAPRGRGKGSNGANVLRELGEHPEGGAIQILTGLYGPYIKHGKLNVTVPKEMKPEDVSVEQAISWLAAKAASGPSKPGRGRKSSSTTKKTTTKSTKAPSSKTTSKSTSPKSGTKKSGTKKS
jgi:DNA topoisomerase-1